jgi:hypothetical protein
MPQTPEATSNRARFRYRIPVLNLVGVAAVLLAGPADARHFDYVPLYIIRGLQKLHIEFTGAS